MNDNLRTQIYNSMSLKETDELIHIWQQHNSNEWTDLAFEVVENILRERLGELPLQDKFDAKVNEREFDKDALPKRNSKKVAPNSYQARARIIGIFILAIALIGFLFWRYKAVRIGREQAIQNAIQFCPGLGLEQVEQPTEFQAELTTFGKAMPGWSRFDSGKPVWVVSLKGRWLLLGGPPPADPNHAEPVYWDECTIVIDAQTGKSLSIPIQ